MALRDTSIVWKVNICLQVSAFIMTLVGFGSNYIVVYTNPYSDIYAGLWKVCFSKDICPDTDEYLDDQQKSTEWLDVSKGMMSISIGVHFLAMFMAVGSAFINASKMIMWFTATAEFIAALFGIIGVAVACAKIRAIVDDALSKINVTSSISWSFVLFLISQFAYIMAGLLHLLDAKLKFRSHPSAAVQSINSQAPSKISSISSPS